MRYARRFVDVNSSGHGDLGFALTPLEGRQPALLNPRECVDGTVENHQFKAINVSLEPVRATLLRYFILASIGSTKRKMIRENVQEWTGILPCLSA
jgi:hypothetical protein